MSTGVGEDDTDLLKVPQVATRLNVSKPTVWRLIASGELESILVAPRSRRVRPAAVDAYLKSKLSAPAADAGNAAA